MNNLPRIIPRTGRPGDTPPWQRELARAISRPEELLALLGLAGQPGAAALAAARDFPLRVPRGFVARMVHGDPDDPLLRQVLPVDAEGRTTPGYLADPLQEAGAMTAPGVLHKYRGRVLLTVTGACAVHCRYCFRRHYPYAEANAAAGDWGAALDYLAAQTDVSEVLLSGGDPLSLSDGRLADLVTRLEAIPHLRRLRIHTRLPVVLPERVDAGLAAWLGGTRLQTVVVLHCNHPNEVDAAVAAAAARLAACGATLLNQAVLLRGVNDSAQTLAGLSEVLFGIGVLPYYLHQLDRVQGAAHFAVEDAVALTLMDAVHAALPGYLVPRLVREHPAAAGKTLLWPRP